MTGAEHVARAWLAEMEACVRTIDFARCRAIFAGDVVGFGSKAALVVGLNALEHDQWRHVWPAIRRFTFLLDQMHCGSGGDKLIWIACPWSSELKSVEDAWIARPGRMTAVLEHRDGLWLAVHTHHSQVPAT